MSHRHVKTNEVQTHRTDLEVTQPPPHEIEIGGNITLKVRARCVFGCDLCGTPVQVLLSEQVAASGDLVTFDQTERISETDDFIVTAPGDVGEHIWTIRFPRRESGGIVHEETVLALPFRTAPHEASIAVWGIPSPVATGERLTMKVGVKSSAACDLTGACVEVRDESGVQVGSCRLGETPWPGTAALYWSEVEFAAPSTTGVVSYSVGFVADGLQVPHRGAPSRFSFATVPRPEHRLTVTVVDKETGLPVEDAYVRAGVHRGSTDGSGVTHLLVAAGTYEVTAWKARHLPSTATVEVIAETAVQLACEAIPEDNPWALPV